jgi:ubiquinone/menaquinone biosynthesis C-methylase UbiE
MMEARPRENRRATRERVGVSAFDAVAASFDRDRPLPGDVPAEIRSAVLEHAAIDPRSPLLDVGCGSGRLGAVFCEAGDNYVGVDASAEMLRAFRARVLPRPPRLVLADGAALPFGVGTFEALMFMHVLNARNAQPLLSEAARVLRPHGVLVIGKAESPADGIDAMMRRRLEAVLAEMGVDEPRGHRDAMAARLSSMSTHVSAVLAASWRVARSPRDFLSRKASAARFGQLAAPLREAALNSLVEWAERNIGPLDQPHPEQHHFRLQLFRLRERGHDQ